MAGAPRSGQKPKASGSLYKKLENKLSFLNWLSFWLGGFGWNLVCRQFRQFRNFKPSRFSNFEFWGVQLEKFFWNFQITFYRIFGSLSTRLEVGAPSNSASNDIFLFFFENFLKPVGLSTNFVDETFWRRAFWTFRLYIFYSCFIRLATA